MARPEPGAAVFVADLPDPQAGVGEVRVRIANAAICGTDRHIFHWDSSVASMLTPPVVIGHEFCGHIDQIGSEVSGWEEGDYVSAEMHIVCGKCPSPGTPVTARHCGYSPHCRHSRLSRLGWLCWRSRPSQPFQLSRLCHISRPGGSYFVSLSRGVPPPT